VLHHRGPDRVVKGYAVDTGPYFGNNQGSYAATSYRYYGGKMHVTGRGFLGYRRIEAVNHNTGILSINEHRQDYPFTGMLEASSQYRSIGQPPSPFGDDNWGSISQVPDGGFCDISGECVEPQSGGMQPLSMGGSGSSGQPIKVTTQELALMFSAQADRPIPYVETITSANTELGSEAAYRTEIAETEYDNWGNAVATVVRHEDGNGNEIYRIETGNVYGADDPGSWCLGRLTQSTVTHV
jgi:hypothetical protein